MWFRSSVSMLIGVDRYILYTVRWIWIRGGADLASKINAQPICRSAEWEEPKILLPKNLTHRIIMESSCHWFDLKVLSPWEKYSSPLISKGLAGQDCSRFGCTHWCGRIDGFAAHHIDFQSILSLRPAMGHQDSNQKVTMSMSIQAVCGTLWGTSRRYIVFGL